MNRCAIYKSNGFIEEKGYGRGAVWFLVKKIRRNKPWNETE